MRFSSASAIGLLVLALVGGCDNGGGNGGTGGSGNGGNGETGGGGEVGVPCGDAGTCGPGQVCSWHYGSCGHNNPIDFTECIDAYSECGPQDKPVCACNEQIYDNYCEAAANGVDVGQEGSCVAPEGFFLCGSYVCTSGTEYCHLNDIIDAVNATCKPLPSGCADCDCLLPDEPGGGDPFVTCTCTESADHLTVSCEGGGI